MPMSPRPEPLKWVLLGSLFAFGGWYLAAELQYSATRDRTGEAPLRTGALLIHLVFAAPLLLLPPFQFSRRLRARWPAWHRRAGTLYLVGAIVASAIAIYLGLTFHDIPRRVPLLVFSLVWLACGIAAWRTARLRDFAAHERFVARTYAIALAFVLVRVLGGVALPLFAFMPDKGTSALTREWLSFVLPLLAVETWYASSSLRGWRGSYFSRVSRVSNVSSSTGDIT